jgi:hypothetical protein
MSGHTPASRPLRSLTQTQLKQKLDAALAAADGLTGAHCIHELWMRSEIGANLEQHISRLWSVAASSIPEWLPMRYVEWLPLAYEATQACKAKRRGMHNVYLVLLDYADSRGDPHGIYVGMSRYQPAERFDQHKAGIRAAGCVTRRGLEVLTGPTLHLQKISRPDAARIEEELAEALRARGLFVQGGH